MSVSAGGAGASALLSAAATKILSVGLGPSSIALLSTLQQLRQTALVAATANGQTALVQGASAFDSTSRREYVRTVAWIFGGFTAAAAMALAGAPGWIGRWAGLGPEAAGEIRMLGCVVALSSLFVFESALLNALGAVGALAALQLAGPGAMALLAWPLGKKGSFSGLLAAAAAASAAAACLALRPYRRTLADWFGGSGRAASGRSAAHFFSLSGAMLATGLAGSAALLTVRSWILRGQGLAEAGQFDAAWGISMNQATLVLASLQTWYLPALARGRAAEHRGAQIARVLTVAAPAAAAAIVLLALAKPLVLTLLYSAAFRPAAHYLRWTLIGDYLKVASWILSVPMLASADVKMFLTSDLASVAALVGSAAALARWKSPAESAAMAFVGMHIVHLAICAWYAVRRHAFRLAGPASFIWLAGLAAVGTVSALTWS